MRPSAVVSGELPSPCGTVTFGHNSDRRLRATEGEEGRAYTGTQERLKAQFPNVSKAAMEAQKRGGQKKPLQIARLEPVVKIPRTWKNRVTVFSSVSSNAQVCASLPVAAVRLIHSFGMIRSQEPRLVLPSWLTNCQPWPGACKATGCGADRVFFRGCV
jgi:hypothetical protein